MIIILKPGATDEQIDHVIQRVESLGLTAHLSRGTHRTIVGVIGDESQLAKTRAAAVEARQVAVDGGDAPLVSWADYVLKQFDTIGKPAK